MQKESPPCRSSAGRLKERRRTPKTEGMPFIYYTRFSGRKAIDETDKSKTSGLCKSPKVGNFQKIHEKGLTSSGNHAIMIPESKRTGQQPTTKTADAVAANPPQKGRYTMAYFYKRKQGITAQKIFNMISDAECEAFCFASDHPKDKKLQECAEHMRKALKAFHEATGAKNEE